MSNRGGGANDREEGEYNSSHSDSDSDREARPGTSKERRRCKREDEDAYFYGCYIEQLNKVKELKKENKRLTEEKKRTSVEYVNKLESELRTYKAKVTIANLTPTQKSDYVSKLERFVELELENENLKAKTAELQQLVNQTDENVKSLERRLAELSREKDEKKHKRKKRKKGSRSRSRSEDKRSKKRRSRSRSPRQPAGGDSPSSSTAAPNPISQLGVFAQVLDGRDNEVSELKKQLVDVRLEKDRLAEKSKEMYEESEIITLQTRINELSKEGASKQRVIDQLKENIVTKESEACDRKQDFSQLEIEKNRLDKELSDKTAEFDRKETALNETSRKLKQKELDEKYLSKLVREFEELLRRRGVTEQCVTATRTKIYAECCSHQDKNSPVQRHTPPHRQPLLGASPTSPSTPQPCPPPDLQNHIGRWEAIANELESRKDELQEKNNALVTEKTDLESQLTTTRNDLCSARQAKTELHGAVKELTTDRDRLRTESRQFDQRLELLNKKHQREIDVRVKTAEKLQTDLTDLQGKYGTVEKERNESEKQRDEMAGEHSNCLVTISGLRNKESELENQLEQLKETHGQCENNEQSREQQMESMNEELEEQRRLIALVQKYLGLVANALEKRGKLFRQQMGRLTKNPVFHCSMLTDEFAQIMKAATEKIRLVITELEERSEVAESARDELQQRLSADEQKWTIKLEELAANDSGLVTNQRSSDQSNLDFLLEVCKARHDSINEAKQLLEQKLQKAEEDLRTAQGHARNLAFSAELVFRADEELAKLRQRNAVLEAEMHRLKGEGQNAQCSIKQEPSTLS